MHLALGGARADRAPGHQVGDVLRRDHVQKLGAGRHAQRVDVAQQAAGNAQALVDAEAAVEVGVVDQPLPADRGARLLEIHPHHDLQRVAQFAAQRRQPRGILQRRAGVVDRAGSDHHGEAVVAAAKYAVQGLPRSIHGRDRRVAGSAIAHDLGRRAEGGDGADAQVVGGVHGGSPGGSSGGGQKKPPWIGGSVWFFRSVQNDRVRAAAVGFG